MKSEMFVTVDHDETRAAIMEDERLVELFVERPLAKRIVSNIYKGKVENVLPGMQAAFVNVGLERNAFLYVDDAYPWRKDDDDSPPGPRRATIKDLVREGQDVMVQVVKEPTGGKGARVTRDVSIPGRYLVLMPAVEYVGVSRRIESDKERERLKKMAYAIKPKNLGVIVRTAAEGQSQKALEQDMKFLVGIWKGIEKKRRTMKAPCLLHKDQGLVYRILRDHITEETRRVVVDDPDECRKMQELATAFSPDLKSRIQLFKGKPRTLFEEHGLNEEMEAALRRRVWLKSGGYIVFDQTEALTVIDVNTGRYVGSRNLQDTVFKTNMEAADEIARQLRLRDIGGIIVIDFIDMESPNRRQKVVSALERHLGRDKTRATVLGITQLGLVEMTRKKGRKNLVDLMTRQCPYCDGYGRTLSEESMSRKVRREIRRILRNNTAEAILVEVHPSVASLLIGVGGSNLKELERETQRSIYIRGSEDCHLEEMHMRALGSKREVEERALPVRAGQVLDLKVEEHHVTNVWDGIARVEGYVIDIEGGGDRVGENVKVEITKAFRTYAKGKILSA